MYVYVFVYAKPGYKKCEANQKQHCKWLQVAKTFDIKKFNCLLE